MKKLYVLAAACAMGAAYGDVVLENDRVRLSVGDDAVTKSMVLKETGEELLDVGEGLPLFSVTQDRPFNNEIKLVHPNKRTTFRANRVRREGSRLVVGFELVSYEAEIAVSERPEYVLFELKDFRLGEAGANRLTMTYPPVASLRMLQLPVRERKRFGEWMNVCSDDSAAVAVLGAEPYTWIDSERRGGCRMLTADACRDLKLRGAKCAIVAASTGAYLDCVDAFERDLGLPLGVASRRSAAINRSMYWSGSVTPANIDAHLDIARRGGFRMMLLYYTGVFATPPGTIGYGGIGDYKLHPAYTNDYGALKAMLDKIKAAGITPGLHVLHTFAGFNSSLVRPVADPRLNLKTHFTLAKPLGKGEDDVFVFEDPSNCPTNDRSRILAFGGEFISYRGFTTERPYRFTGIERGIHGTTVVEHQRGQIGGLLDVCEYGGTSCYVDQDTDLQDEIAEKIARAYDCGFEFMYFDGSEGVSVPQGIHVANAQYRVWRKLRKKPLFTEGAAKSHFGWHHLSGANAFDVFPPETFKAMIVRWPLYEAPLMRADFSRLNFGWWGVMLPGTKLRDGTETIGTQPDMWEFGTSRAAAWDCPISVQMYPPVISRHPRKDDLLDVIRRWEDVRARNWLTPAQKEALKSPTRQHHLYRDGKGGYELHEIEMLVPETAKGLRAFMFERSGRRVVAYWHTSGEGDFTLALGSGGAPVTLHAAGIAYYETDLPAEAVRSAFVGTAGKAGL